MAAAWIYTLVPAGAAVLGAAAASLVRPSREVASAIRHFAAGIVFAAAAVELLPDLLRCHEVAPTLAGGAIGIAAMLAVRHCGEKASGPAGLLATVGVDVLVDGLVLGIGFQAGAKAGALLTLALTIEVLFLGLTVVGELRDEAVARWKAVAAVAAVAALLPLGAIAATPVAALQPTIVEGFFAFALIALLYLVTEELLVEAHETQDRAWTTAMFFVGFLIIVAIEQATS